MAIINFTFAGSTSNAGNYYGFSFYLTAEGASTEIGTSVSLNSIYFEATSGSSSQTTPLYLNLWKKDTGESVYTYLGSSTNADYCTSVSQGGKSATWNFSNITINPASKYVVIFSAGSTSTSWSFNQYGRIPVYPVTNDALHTVYSANQSNPPTVSQAWAPKMTLTLEGDVAPHTDTNAKLKLKIMTTAQLATESKASNIFYVDTDKKQLFLGNKFLAGSKDGTLINTATGTNSLSILGGYSTSQANTIIIGNGASAGESGISVGVNAKNNAGGGVVIGQNASSNSIGVVLGWSAKGYGSNAIAIGSGANVGSSGSDVNGAIQIGSGTNNNASTLQVFNYQLLDNSGTIPAERLGTLPVSDGEYLPKLTITDGVPTITWVSYTPTT